ncbi:hypothetical protein CQ012_02235 [Arthrobacter sp. MYb214]|uniref:DUF2746 domain-containing protein n=1 Tax=Arthrobacter sp. MYb214 TaxID=1848596 RepID=UPI000CFB6118|nr:DUF2746 domain-containing protein [Arthrobacter sp. MYb214]PRB78228.1 hypothetical protein CQ012_02235 [Arthrobacter sp. MYb214]
MPEWLTEAVIIQALITVGVILGAGIPAYFVFKSKLAEIGKDAKEARVQVKNSHSTNLREEQDERHLATMDLLKELGRDVRGLREENYETRKDIGMLHAEDRAGRRETQKLRQEFSEHTKQTENWTPMLTDLHELYSKKPPAE